MSVGAAPASDPRTTVVLFNRDLRVHDHPALTAATQTKGPVVPLFVLDKTLLRAKSANRLAFLLDALEDLDGSLRQLGTGLFVRQGDPAVEAMKVAAQTNAAAIFVSADVTPVARRREERLEAACRTQRIEFRRFPGVTVVPAGDLLPSSADHYRVFTPYWNRWRGVERRPILPAPRSLSGPNHLAVGHLPAGRLLSGRMVSPQLRRGGEALARKDARRFVGRGVELYDDARDDLAADQTSRLSPFLHFGCVSPSELASWVEQHEAGAAFLRQLCWRDFHHQVLAAFPDLATRDYRPRGRTWRDDDAAAAAWREGRSGVPIVDAGMRQLQDEGWMHNRARLIVAAYLTRELELHWTIGATHFMDWLVDGDVANNAGNWQWVAGTGNDTRPNRRFNVLRQAHRFDPSGDYVRRFVPELVSVRGGDVHEPWRLDENIRTRLDYPEPLASPFRSF